MKKLFITGLVILLPLTLTIWVVAFIFNLLTDPFVGIFRSIFHYFGIVNSGFLFLSPTQVQDLVSKISIAVFLFFFTVLLGLFGRMVLMRYFFKAWDFILHRIPFVSSIYITCQDVIKTIFTSKASAFKKVVMVPFPNAETLTIGLVTRENIKDQTNPTQKMTAVFVPTAPNPTSGFLMLFPEKTLIHIDMKVEDAFKYIISCGVIMSPIKSLTTDNNVKTE